MPPSADSEGHALAARISLNTVVGKALHKGNLTHGHVPWVGQLRGAELVTPTSATLASATFS